MLRRIALGLVVVLTGLSWGSSPAFAGDSSSGSDVSINVVGGVQIPISSAPWQVALVSSSASTNFLGQFCGGSLISTEWVVTAAHCVVNSSGSQRQPSEFSILAGTSSLSTTGRSGLLGVSSVVVNPQYSRSALANDIALVKLSQPITLQAGSVSTISLMRGQVGTGQSALISGWGATQYLSPSSSPSYYPSALYGATVYVQSDSTCTSYLSSSYQSASMMCAGTSGFWQDTCYGDSGGPLAVTDNGAYALAGITSWGRGCGWTTPGVYTRVSSFANWIDSTITGPALTPTFSTPVRTATGFTVNVTNYNAAYTFTSTVTSGTVTAGAANGATLPLTVTGVAANASATITTTVTRTGYTNGTGTVTGTALALTR